MPKPRCLRPGSHIRIVAPASPIDPVKLKPGVRLLEENGYRVSFGKHVFDNHYYLAGLDGARAEDLNDAFEATDVDMVYCARGGYGCARLLPLLHLDSMAKTRKLFAGFSDITSLHLALNRRGMPTLYAPMALTWIKERKPWVVESFLCSLRGENPIPKGARRGKTLVPGRAEGATTGGCLCLLTDSIGTADQIDFEGKIVLIEDVDEQSHRIDAMLTHLLNIGQLQKCAGIVVGEMTRTDRKHDTSIGKRPWREVLEERLAPLGKPTIIGFPFGHMPTMLSLPLGISARLDATAGTLTYTEALCES